MKPVALGLALALSGCWPGSVSGPSADRPLTPWPGESPDRTSPCFSRWLRLTDEPPLGVLSGDNYRFTFDAAFGGYSVHVIRLTHTERETLLVRKDVSSGGERARTRYVSAGEWQTLSAHFAAIWTWTPDDPSVGSDGDWWSFEAFVDGRYRCVRRWTPEGNPDKRAEYELGRELLTAGGVIGF